MNAVRPIAPVKSVMYRSPSPADVYTYSPGICALESGRLIGTMDLGGKGVERYFQNTVPLKAGGPGICGQVFVSDDRGASWRRVAQFPFCHARPFVAGKSVYVLGHAGDLRVIRSDDGGETWSDCVQLTHDPVWRWHQAPASVVYAGDYVYLVMERYRRNCKIWPVSVLEPVLMRGCVRDDLTRVENWTFSDSSSFRDLMDYTKTDYFGVPFYSLDPDNPVDVSDGDGRWSAPIGWLETNVVRIVDPDHIWYDPTGRTFHLFMRAHTGRTNYCCVAKVVEKDDGSMKMEAVKAPSGKTLLYLPMPGGQMKFHIIYDAPTKLYWLLSSQATDSMIRPNRMPANRYNLPDNERHRLQLHFSKNCVDWCFAAMVDSGETPLCSRHYASMCVSGDSLYVLSRSGDRQAASAHNGDLITLHEIERFRELVY